MWVQRCVLWDDRIFTSLCVDEVEIVKGGVRDKIGGRLTPLLPLNPMTVHLLLFKNRSERLQKLLVIVQMDACHPLHTCDLVGHLMAVVRVVWSLRMSAEKKGVKGGVDGMRGKGKTTSGRAVVKVAVWRLHPPYKKWMRCCGLDEFIAPWNSNRRVL